jgi:hypothetical protein
MEVRKLGFAVSLWALQDSHLDLLQGEGLAKGHRKSFSDEVKPRCYLWGSTTPQHPIVGHLGLTK